MTAAAGGRWAGPAGWLCLLLLAFSAAFLKTRSYDFGWHLAAGETMLERRELPSVDEFSFTSAGAPWADHEWLFQGIAALLFRALGHSGLAILKGVCALGVAVAGWLSLRRAECGGGTALAVVALAMAGMRPRLAERPESVSLALAAILAAILLDLSRGEGRARGRLIAAGLLTLVWANLHAAVLLAPVLALAIAAGGFLESRICVAREARDLSRRGAKRTLGAAAVLLLAIPVNPYGLDLFGVPLRIQEALGPANLVNPEWLAPTPAAFPFFFGAAAVAALVALYGMARRRPGAGRSVALLAPVLALGMTSARHTGLFFALAPAIASGLPWIRSTAGMPSIAGAIVCVAVSGAMLVIPPAGAEPGVGLQASRFPVKAVAFLDSRMPDVRAYNDTAFGGYMIWSGWPERRVFQDGRNEVHAALLRDLSAALDDGRRWAALMDRHAVEAAVLGYRPDRIQVRDAGTGRLSQASFSDTHFPRGSWALVHWDDVAMVFVRRDGRFGSLAQEMEYRHIRPEAALLGLVQAPAAAESEEALRELRRKLEEDPDCPLARRVATVYGLGLPVR